MTVTPHKAAHLLLICKLGEGNFAKLAAFPGYSRWLDRNLIIRVTGANLAYLLEQWPDAEWIGGADEVRSAYLHEKEQAMQTAKDKSREGCELVDSSGYRYHREPMEHQHKAFLLSRDRPAFGLFMEQGTGKTKVIIDTACYLYHQKKIEVLIVVAWPNGVHRNWVEYELPEDMSVPYVAEYWANNHETRHKRIAYQKMLRQTDKLRVFTFNIEAFVSPMAQGFITEILERFNCLFVIDQSASIKNPNAKRTKFLVDKVSKLAPFRRVLDGAPVAEGADELYSQFKFLDPMIIGHDTWTGFKAEFCEIGYFSEIKGYKNLDLLRSRIDGYCFRVLSDECQDLPARVYKRWTFDLSKEEQRIFDDLKVKELAFFEELPEEIIPKDDPWKNLQILENIEEHRALIKNLRLQQIASGWWPGEEFKPIDPELPARARALLDLLKAAPGKALIFSRFRADLELIARLLGDKAVSYHGGVSEEDRALAKRRFMKDPKALYFIGQPRSAGIGHTLTAAKHVIFYSNDPSLRLREECEKRAHREGLKHELIIWDLIASGSHDAKVVRALRDKKELANVIMADPDTFFLQHE